MNIGRLGAAQVYKTNLAKAVETEHAKKTCASVESKEKPMDTITISAQAANRKAVDKAVRAAKSDFVSEAPAQKIEMLKKLVAEGNYHVSSSDLADRIMGLKK